MNIVPVNTRSRKAKLHREKIDRLRREMKQLKQQIDQLARMPCAPTEIRLGRYRHYKDKEYEVIGIARHSETLEELVVYRALYGDHDLWVRPRNMFEESVVIEGRRIPRFTPVTPPIA